MYVHMYVQICTYVLTLGYFKLKNVSKLSFKLGSVPARGYVGRNNDTSHICRNHKLDSTCDNRAKILYIQ